ncbi:tripartite tricarboxylate transporter TctB family protein [Streptosporangium sp. NPDC051022]|uniref:tripartite tricarboxylate transporter TctB family protein n=1 Tax=Streptosporangium sp. NPDC051022 TaxID=3155752 RepID=UPI00343FCA90
MTKLPHILSLLLVALAGSTLVGSLQRDVWTDLGPGPGFFPLVVGGLLLALSVALTVELVREPDDKGEPATDGPALDTDGSHELSADGQPSAPVRGDTAGELSADLDSGATRAASHEAPGKPRTLLGGVPGPVLVVSALVVSLMFMNVLGFRISIGLLVFFVLAVVERIPVHYALALALAISLGSFHLFSDLLDVQL